MKTPIPEIPKASQKQFLALHHGCAYLTGHNLDRLQITQPEVAEDNYSNPAVALEVYGDDIKRLYVFLKERFKDEENEIKFGSWKFTLVDSIQVWAERDGLQICMDTVQGLYNSMKQGEKPLFPQV